MNKDKLVAEMLTAKAEKNNTIDLDTYANGLADMYDRLVNLCNLPIVNGWHLFSDEKPTIGKYLDIEWNDGTTDENIRYDGFNPNLPLIPVRWRACR